MTEAGILVTGHRGFVGQAVGRALDKAGHKWWGVDLRGGGPVNALSFLKPGHLRETSAVIHLAAYADIQKNWGGDGLRERRKIFGNVTNTVRLLEVCAYAPSVSRFIFASTSSVYGQQPSPAPYGHCQEEQAVEAISPYAASKLAGEAYVQAYAHAMGWRWYCARLAGMVGRGYRHGHLIDIMRAKYEGRPFLGRDEGTPKSMVHVDAAAHALVSMATEYFPPGVYNVAQSGPGWSWRHSAEMVGVPYAPGTQQRGWVGDTHGTILETCKLEDVFNRTVGEPTVAEGVAEAIADIEAHAEEIYGDYRG